MKKKTIVLEYLPVRCKFDHFRLRILNFHPHYVLSVCLFNYYHYSVSNTVRLHDAAECKTLYEAMSDDSYYIDKTNSAH